MTVEAWDSVNHLNLVLALEGEFQVSFSPEEIGLLDGQFPRKDSMLPQAPIYIVTVNYNNSSYTCSLIDNLSQANERGDNVMLIIVDNASRPHDIENIEAHGSGRSWVEILKSPANLGYFRGLNLGLDRVPEASRNNIIVCNNDLIFAADFFSLLRKEANPEGAMVLAPRVTTIAGRQQNPYCARPISAFRLFCFDLYYANYYLGCLLLWLDEVAKKLKPAREPSMDRQIIYMGIGACYILTRAFFERCGKLDDRIFLWGEEALLTAQLKAVGGQTLFVPDLKVIHNENGPLAVSCG